MGTIYARGNILWIGFGGRDGRWRYKSSGYEVGRESDARAMLEAIEKQIRQGNRVAELGPLSVLEYGRERLKHRKAAGITDAGREWERVELHVGPLGKMRIYDVRPSHVREWVRELGAKGLAPRSVSNIYGAIRRLFNDAIAEELVETTPCALLSAERPRRRDKHPAWRATAHYERDEVELLISSPKVDEDRRVLFALAALTGMREGEIAALRWSAYAPDIEPLGRISVHASYTRHVGHEKSTKTGVARRVPVHPTLARILADWKLSGWARQFRRKPRPEDLVLPNREGGHITEDSCGKAIKRSCAALGLTYRRFHDLRRTFVSLGIDDGADNATLKLVTHLPPSTAHDVYKSLAWPTLCRAVACLKVRGRPFPTKSTTARMRA